MQKGKFISAVILAAGSSSRMGIDKITADLNGKPVLLYSVEKFLKSCADELIIVASEGNIDAIKELLHNVKSEKPIKTILGGKERNESAVNAFNAMSENSDIISVHDGARPLVTCELCNRVTESAIENGGAIAAVRVKDTIKKVDNGFISDTPERKNLMSAQTPQAFTKEVYKKAIEYVAEHNAEITDDASAAELVGCNVAVVEGDYRNIKLTSPEDLIIAKAFLSE
ncbi:MAG: 2-C-methyl-D-erythritol 4-phosphate cytidylyltransferase [Ruminococcaceae bacterium]|nr:2-C-methyl-D-erythritol 4-phosphate cytidylyltransferase [Oscillospiraceae bacterium]